MRKIILYSIVLIATTNLFPISEYTINDVYLSLDGSWEFNISSMTDRDLSSALKNTIFEQLPDVSASLWLFNKFFFETHIENNNEKNLFLLGYQDNQSFLKEIRVGNDDLNISEYADFTPPINTLGAPGARIRLESENSKHEILARYSGEEYSNCKYIGFNQLEIENIKLNNYINGKFFIIPSDNVGNIELYTIEDGINTYIDQQDFIYYRDLSLLYIKEKQNIPIFISINNNQPVELYSPGKNSEYHFLGAYMLPTNSNKSTINVKVNEDKIFNYTIIDEYILFLDPTIKATAEDYRHPFKELDSQIYLKGGSGLNSKYEIEIETLTPVSNISIPTEAKQGTITIDLNGVEYFHFTYDSESRIIDMNRELTPFDEISINYKTDSLLGTGNLLLSYGSRYTVFNNLMLDLSTTGSWDFSPDDYSSIEGENRGSIRSIGLIKYNNDFINSSIKTEIGVENPDTNGKYTLFNYGQIERVLSIDNISPDTPLLEDAIPFTLRSDNDLLLEIEDIKNLPINDIGGAYIINNIYEGVGYKALVLENSELLENQSSMVNMTLGELKGDYSWAKTFSLDILNQDIERTITINFTNSNLTESTVVLSKKIELDKNEKYKTYPVPFSRDDREKLSYIDGYQIVLTNSDSSIALIKNSCFSGDSIISVDTDYDYYLKKENSGFSIEIENISNSDHEIKLSSPVSSIDPENYRYMEFNLENNGIINSDSLFTLELGTSASIYGTVKVPGNLLISGKNKIKVDFIDKIVWVNNVVNPDSSWNIGNGKKTDLITININNIGKGTLFISDIVLTDPQLSFWGKSSVNLELTPKIDLEINSFPLLQDVNINLEGDFFMDDYSIAYGKSSISMTLLGTSFQGNSIYKMDKGISAIGYKIVMPSISSPIVIKELFNYGESLTREDELILSTKYIVGNLSLKLDKNNDTSLRTTTTSIEITPVKPISLHSSATLTQSSGDELENMNKEFVNSYSELIPTDNLDIKNSFVAKSRLNINSSLFNILTTGSVAFDQSKAIINSENNKYTGNITINVPLSTLSITTLLESSYFTSINNNTQLLSNGFESIINNFGNTNPYKNIDLETLFFLGDSDQFYNSYAFIKERTLDSSISLKVAYNSEINSFLNFLIPNSIEGSFTKKLSRIESSQTSLLGYKIDGKFNLNSFVKNKIEYVNIFNIEKNSNDSSIKWDMRLLIDLPRNNSLELSNNLMYDTEETSNILKGNYTWDGKDGPVYIVPLLNYAIEKPYQYTNKEILYLNSKNLESWTMGLRHETELNISDVNKTLIFLDATYDSQSKTPLILGFGITLTLIF